MNTKDMAQSERELFTPEMAKCLLKDADDHVLGVRYAEELAEVINAARAPLLSRIAELEALSVTNIMIDVVPGDGSGYEVFAKSVDQIEDLLTRMSYEVRELKDRLKAAEKDAERMDFLEGKGSSGLLWVARESATGRGYRVHQLSVGNPGEKTARAAIDAAIRGNE
jgi:hypothetical protein